MTTCLRCSTPLPPGGAGCPVCGYGSGSPVTGPVDVLPADPPVAAPHLLAQALVVLLGLCAVCDLLGVLTGWHYLAGLGRLLADPALDVDTVTGAEARYGTVGQLQALTYVATGVTWLVWQYRTYGAVRDLGATGLLRHGQGWSIGAWFVPFLNLVRPLRMVDDLWTGPDPELPDRGPLTAGGGTRLVPAWWAALLGACLLSRIGAALPAETLEQLRNGVRVWLAGDLVWLAADVLALLLVHRLSRRVRAQARVRGRLATV